MIKRGRGRPKMRPSEDADNEASSPTTDGREKSAKKFREGLADSSEILTSTLTEDDLKVENIDEDWKSCEIDIETIDSPLNESSTHPSFKSIARDFNFEWGESESEEDQKYEAATLEKKVKRKADVSKTRKRKLESREDSFVSIGDLFQEELENDVRVLAVPSQNFEILSLDHPASVTLHGYIKVTVLTGEVSILGRELKEDSEERVFSGEDTGLLQLRTTGSGTPLVLKHLQAKLTGLMIEEEKVHTILTESSRTTSVVLLERKLLPFALQFLELYYPKAVNTRREVVKERRSMEVEALCSTNEGDGVIKFESREDVENIKCTLLASVIAGKGSRVMMYGSKQSGKSTLLRYLINSVSNKYDDVFYLDVDTGQTEFTPPGVVSLSKVTEALLGPPFVHQRSPVRMIFTGSVTPETSPSMYLKSVQRLIKYFNDKHPNAILFVNTMGWISGIGDLCNREILKSLKPSVVIEFTASDQEPVLKEEMIKAKVDYFKLPKRVEINPPYFSPIDLRNFALLSYFGKCQKFYMRPSYLNDIRPLCVKWDDIAIGVIGKKLPANRLIEAIHCSVVALCHVSKTSILEYEKPGLPKTLTDEPQNACLGFGIVRATDEENHLLYIVSPLKVGELKNVNAIIKGNVMMPNAVFLQQHLVDVPLPYTDDSVLAPPSSRKVIKNRSSKRSVRHHQQ